MPGIVVFGRRWAVGSDDFVFPAAGEIIVRVVWLIMLSVVFAVNNDNLSQCEHLYTLRVYFIGVMIILSLTMILSCTIMYYSMQGSITNSEPRKHVPNLIILKLLLFLMEIIWTAIGTYWAFNDSVAAPCPSIVVNVVKGTLVVGWLLLFVLLIGIFIVFDPLGRHSRQAESEAQLQKLWKLRCRLLCCCCVGSNVGDSSKAFEDVARIFAEHLLGLDFVVTDLAAAMILVQQQQKSELLHRRRTGCDISHVPYASVGNSSSSVDNSDFCPKDWMTVTVASAFMKFAACSYGWPYFIYDNQCTGPFRLWCKCRCCRCLRPTDNVYNDNCCGCNTSAILEQTHINREDIFYANFHNQLYEVPFYIAFSHEHKSVVLSIRGTLSFEDVLTDMSADIENMVVEGVPDAKAHKGILQAARYIERMLMQYHLLEDAFSRVPDYRLVIVGHSLGAGAAAILSIFMKPKYPDLRCFAYSPPGWLLSLPLSRYAEEFVCSVVVGKDLVPRLGFVTIERLKQKMIDAVSKSNKPKYRILAGSVWNAIFNCYDDVNDDVEGTGSQPLLSGSSTRRLTYTEEAPVNDNTDNSRNTSATADANHLLFLPGLVMFLEETGPGRGCFGIPSYSAHWMKPESFDEILLSGMKMIHDHFPNVVYRALKSVQKDLDNRADIII